MLILVFTLTKIRKTLTTGKNLSNETMLHLTGLTALTAVSR